MGHYPDTQFLEEPDVLKVRGNPRLVIDAAEADEFLSTS